MARKYTIINVVDYHRYFSGTSQGSWANVGIYGCVCFCVFFPFILDLKFVGRTSRGHTGFLIHLFSAVLALIFLARRIQPFLSLVDREVEFCGHLYFCIF